MIFRNIFNVILIICVSIFCQSCDKVFEFTPYSARVDDADKNTTLKNLELLQSIELATDTFSFAFITDTHEDYNDLRTAVDDISKMSHIQFVLIGGDFTTQGLLKEYKEFHHIMNNLRQPYFTVIGNHDYRSNGDLIYKEMFGDYNYSFVFKQSKFILFDAIVWESESDPDLNWLSDELTNEKENEKVFITSHLPPWSTSFKEFEDSYATMVSEVGVSLSIHGHLHSYTYEDFYDDGVNYLVMPNLRKKTYAIVHVLEDSIEVETIEF